MRTGRWRIHSCDNGRSRRRADWGIRPHSRIAQRLFRKRIEMRGDGVTITVTAKVRPYVFACNPQDIGALRGRALSIGRSRKEKSGDHEYASNHDMFSEGPAARSGGP